MGSEGKKDNVGKIDEKDRDVRNRELIRRFREGDRGALNLLLEENEGLLKKAAGRLKGYQYMKEDLLQEARMEMIQLAADFDLQQDKVKFSSYAFDRVFWKMFKIADKASNGQLRKKTKIRQEEDAEEKAKKLIKDAVSLDRQIGEDGETLLDITPDISAEKGRNPENTVLRREYNAELESFLNSGFLTAGEQAVIRGIADGDGYDGIAARLYRKAKEAEEKEKKAKIEKIKRRALEKVMYAGEGEALFPEYAVRYPSDPSLKDENDSRYSAAPEKFLTDSGFLTASERAVMEGIARGEEYEEIGARLHRKTWEIEKIERRALEKIRYARNIEELFLVYATGQWEEDPILKALKKPPKID